MRNSNIYFPNLNGIRFLAAFLVIIHHIELIKSWFGVKNSFQTDSIYYIGKLGVILFFVLSGFLITYLLLVEKSSDKILIKRFYIRRILRIWPLYFFILFLAFFIFPYIPFFITPKENLIHENFYQKLFYFIVFLPNLATIYFNPVTYAVQAWSIGVEEQFYLIWPWIIKYTKKLFLFLIIFILFFNGLEFVLGYLGFHFTKQLHSILFFINNKDIIISNWELFFSTCYIQWKQILQVFNIDCMAIGGIGAYICIKKTKVLPYLFNKYFQILIYLLVIYMLITGFHLKFFTYEIYAILFLIIILNLAINKKTIVHLQFSILDYLGKISYGLYMYHFIGIVIAIKTAYFMFNNYNNVSIFILSILFTIAISSISYEYFEKYFIKKKIKFSNIISGDNVNNKLKL